MLEIKNHGKYFVKDTELLPSQKDEFGHEDIAKNIINIIENTDAPFNIAIVGKWGIGKSSLIKKVVEHCNSNKNSYLVDEVNAWKYEKEALRRVFLKKVLQKLGYKDRNKWNEMISKFNTYRGTIFETKMSLKDILGEWKPLIFMACIIYVIGVIGTFFGTYIQSKLGINTFSTSKWIDFVLTFFVTNIYIPILIVLIQQYIKANSGKMNFKLATPIKTTDEYEDELKEMLTSLNTRKIVIIIDDLDRLTPEKIVEALDAIKAFVNYDNCIFIVPFDESILKQALKRKSSKLNNNEDLLIESELFLDKLFQYKIYLPNVIASNLPQYACDLVKQEAPDLSKLIGEDRFERICKEILIHKGVSTPRQVKKIINTYSNNTLLLLRRENNNALNKIFTSENGLYILAKISVLQADFSEFYNKLFYDSDLINIFLNCVNGESNQVDIPNSLSHYFMKNKEDKYITVKGKYELSKSAEVLYNFLCRTSNIFCDNLLPFLYMANDTISSIFGTELSRDIRNSMTSGAEEIVRRKLEENKEQDYTKLFENILNYADPYEMENCCILLINLYEFYINVEHQKLIDDVGRRLSSIYYTYGKLDITKINFDNLFYIYCKSNEKRGYEKAIVDSLNYEINYIEKLDLFFENETNFSKDAKDKIIDYISNHVGANANVTLQQLFSIKSIDLDNHFDKYFSSFELFSSLSKNIVENGQDEVIEITINKLLNKHIIKGNINLIIEKVLNCFSDNNYFNTVYDLLYEFSDKVDKNIATKLVMKLVQIEEDNDSLNICKLIANLDWVINKDNSNTIDEFILEHIDDDSISDIVYVISKNENIKFIPKSMENILKNIVNNSIGYGVINEFDKQLSFEQRNLLTTSIKDIIAYSSSPSDVIFETIGLILTELIKINENIKYINDILVSQIFNDLTQYTNTPYAYKIINIITIIKDVINDVYLSKFTSWANSVPNMNGYSLVTINIISLFIDKIKQSQYKTIAVNIMAYTNIDSLSISLKVLRKIRTVFEQEGLLNNYMEFLMRYIQIKQNRIEVMGDFEFFKVIDKIPEYVKLVLKYDDIKEQAISSSIKFIQSNQDINDIIQIISDADNETIQVVNEIIKEVKNDNYYYFIKSLVTNASDVEDISYLYNLLIINITLYNSYVEDVISLIKILLKQGDISVIKELFAVLEVLPSDSISKSAKRELGDLLYNIFREETNIENKKAVFNFVIKANIKYPFTKNEERTLREFTNDELILIK